MLKKYGFSLTKEHIDTIYRFSGKKDWGDGLTFNEFKNTILNERVNIYFGEIASEIISDDIMEGQKLP